MRAEILRYFPHTQFVEVGPHSLPLNLTAREDLTSPIRAFFPFSKGIIEVSGADRKSFLQGLCTADVLKLGEREGVRCLFTDKNGKIHFDCFLWANSDHLFLMTDPGEEAGLVQHLEFYRIVEQVELTLRDNLDCFYLLLEEGQAPLAGMQVVYRQKKAQGEWVVALAEQQDQGFTSLQKEGLRPVGFELFEELRPAFELSRSGVDFDNQRLPQEAGLERAVSFTKGCYIGQEPISRIAYRGRVKHKLFCFKGPNPIPSGAPLVAGDQEVGVVTSGSSIQVRGFFYALAYLETIWLKEPRHPLYCATSELLLDREIDPQAQP